MKIKFKSRVVAGFIAITTMLGYVEATPKHLFILSGQSNMQGHKPDEAFTPRVVKEFGESGVIVVQDALGGQPIQRWYKKWTSPSGETIKNPGDLYDRLMGKVMKAIEGHDLKTVTFLWMQGERDAKMSWGTVYEQSLKGVMAQIKRDLKIDNLNFVIGRLSDFDMQNKKYPQWTMVRDIQVKIANSSEYGDWVDTDDLNDGVNRKGKSIKDDLHYSAEGYIEFGRRMAEKSIKLIHKK